MIAIPPVIIISGFIFAIIALCLAIGFCIGREYEKFTWSDGYFTCMMDNEAQNPDPLDTPAITRRKERIG